jgi:hypothetical protein
VRWQSTDRLASTPTLGSSSNNSSDNNNNNKSGLSSGAKAGIGIGVTLAVFAIIAAIILLCVTRRRKTPGKTTEAETLTYAHHDAPEVVPAVQQTAQPGQPELDGSPVSTAYHSSPGSYPPKSVGQIPIPDKPEMQAYGTPNLTAAHPVPAELQSYPSPYPSNAAPAVAEIYSSPQVATASPSVNTTPAESGLEVVATQFPSDTDSERQAVLAELARLEERRQRLREMEALDGHEASLRRRLVALESGSRVP